MFMEQNRGNFDSHEATKVLKSVVDKVRRFKGKNISSFLRAYVCEFEVHQVQDDRIMQTFDLAVVLEIRKRAESWTEFAELLRDECFEED